MKNIFNYSQFINEKYVENPEFKIKSFFEELSKSINKWFTEGTFAANGSILADVKINLGDGLEKNLMFDFEDEENYYQVYVIISLEDVNDNEINDCYVKVKKYDKEAEPKLLKTYGEDVMMDDLTENKITEIFVKLNEKIEKDENPEENTQEPQEVQGQKMKKDTQVQGQVQNPQGELD